MNRCLIAGLGLAAALLAGCKPGHQDPGAEAAAAPTYVRVAVVSRGDIGAALALTGTIEPFRQVHMVPEVAGKIEAILVKEGDQVKKGQVLARLDTRTARLQLAQAAANVAVAEANFLVASKDLERMQDLQRQQSISPQALEKAQLGFETAKAQLEQAVSGRDLAQYQLDVSAMQAPFDGIITGKYLNEGEMINPGMPGAPGVVTLMDISKVKVYVNISEADIEKVKVGQPVQVAVGAEFSGKHEGRVSSMNLAADPLSRSFRAEITVPNEHRQLKVGMYARVKLFTEMRKDVLVVPERTVVAERTQTVAYVVDRNKAGRREVVIGIVSEGRTEIRSGLAEGDSVVVEGNHGLSDGAPVKW